MSGLDGFRGQLHTPGPLYFALLVIPEPATAAIAGSSGVDFVVIDAEHGPFTLASMRACTEALQGTGNRVVVRTASANITEIQQLLDLGIDGVLVPHVETAETAESVVAAVRYPPEGRRGMAGGVRAMGYGLNEDSYLRSANQSLAAMVIIESEAGVHNAAAIAAVPGLDAVIIGTGDLSADMGVTAQYEHPKLLNAVGSAVDALLMADIKVGAFRSPQSLREYESGLVHAFTDANTLTEAAAAAVERARLAWAIEESER